MKKIQFEEEKLKILNNKSNESLDDLNTIIQTYYKKDNEVQKWKSNIL